MYCTYAGCDCIVCLQIEGACQDCELRFPDLALSDSEERMVKNEKR